MRKRGYTLVEIIIVFAVLGVLSAAAYSLISQGKDAAESVDVRAQLTGGARTAMTEIVRDLSETNTSTVSTDASDLVPYFTDPLNGETHQVLVFASARGDPSVSPGEDGVHADNDYVHLDSDYRPVWRSVIIYCTYVTPEGIQQLRKYVSYDNAYSADGMFPFSLTSVSATAINLQKGDGTSLVIARNTGAARANYIAYKDAAITGADFTISNSLMKINLYLSKLELPTKGGTRTLAITLTGSVVMRNK